ncbi:MAG: DUF4301 family protein [Prevotella sp.]|jgi:hypothetical protein
MLTDQDKKQIEGRGMTIAQVEHQLQQFVDGFPFLKLEAAASTSNGILVPTVEETNQIIQCWDDYKNGNHVVTKFVPASGAASRMFKNMFAFLSADYDKPTTDFEKEFFAKINNFAFYDALNEQCKANEGKDIPTLLAEGNYKAIVANLLEKKGLNYGQLPKGLLQFHKYDKDVRTPMEEHLVEAALYASANGKANVHFTVSHDHIALFEKMVNDKKEQYEKKFGVKFHITFSEQKPSTDTIAVNLDNTPFRNEDGSLLFRPGGHGALIENLNDLDSDVVFIKNIDNVVPDRLKEDTVTYKKVLAGILVKIQRQVFDYLKKLDSGAFTSNDLSEMLQFVREKLCVTHDNMDNATKEELVSYLRKKLNRPIRVCGVVKNVGEPGGGPFLAYNQDGTVSLQILESSQIDKSNKDYVKMFTSGTHFNPVDLCCATKDYQGRKFNLLNYVDHATGFISSKSKNGKELKALELPGLWNGAMSDWSTIFVEVPLSTFNPVKTVNDLLREQHQ